MTTTLPERTIDGRARAAALAGHAGAEAEPTSLVSYRSTGRVVVIGEEAAAAAACARLGGLKPTVLVPGEGPPEPGLVEGVTALRGGRPSVEGHLGRFTINVEGAGGSVGLAEATGAASPHFDLVLDLGAAPLLDHDIPPVGYFAPGGDPAALERACEQLTELTGEFDKPKYFAFDPELCAHGRSGLTGCTRCLDACPTRAITSAGDVVSVDPYLCQGAGSCVAACPSGAMTYAFPQASDLIAGLRRLLETFRSEGGTAPAVLFHDGWTRSTVRQRLAPGMPENVIPVEVEEVGSVGMDTWLSLLAYGARAVLVAAGGRMPRRVADELGAQTHFAATLLEGMGYAGSAVTVLSCDDESAAQKAWAGLPESGLQRPARYAAPDEKRNTLRLAIEHLYRHAPTPKKVAELPAGAPFGEIRVDRAACTLCMSCVSVCPAAALAAGGDLPQLKFTEWNCVQCGLCETACPEDAISLHSRFLYDAEARQQPRILHEEQPFCCISCGKPFATRSVLDKLTARLEGHWMFQNEAALKRLQMCEHCRVQDLFRSDEGRELMR